MIDDHRHAIKSRADNSQLMKPILLCFSVVRVVSFSQRLSHLPSCWCCCWCCCSCCSCCCLTSENQFIRFLRSISARRRAEWCIFTFRYSLVRIAFLPISISNISAQYCRLLALTVLPARICINNSWALTTLGQLEEDGDRSRHSTGNFQTWPNLKLIGCLSCY